MHVPTTTNAHTRLHTSRQQCNLYKPASSCNGLVMTAFAAQWHLTNPVCLVCPSHTMSDTHAHPHSSMRQITQHTPTSSRVLNCRVLLLSNCHHHKRTNTGSVQHTGHTRSAVVLLMLKGVDDAVETNTHHTNNTLKESLPSHYTAPLAPPATETLRLNSRSPVVRRRSHPASRQPARPATAAGEES